MTVLLKKLLTTPEAAEELGVAPTTLEIWRCTKRYPLKFAKVGRNIRYRPADIEEFLRLRTHSGVSEGDSSRRRARSNAA